MHLASEGQYHNNSMLHRLLHNNALSCILSAAGKQSAPLGRRLPVRRVDPRICKHKPKPKAHRLADASRSAVWIGAQPPTITPPGQSRSSAASASFSCASSGPTRTPCSNALVASAKRSISMHALPCRELLQVSTVRCVHGETQTPL